MAFCQNYEVMKMMKKTSSFILLESPAPPHREEQDEDGHTVIYDEPEISRLLDELYSDPLELTLVRERLARDKKEDLEYTPHLMHKFFDNCRRNMHLPCVFEVFGQDPDMVDWLAYGIENEAASYVDFVGTEFAFRKLRPTTRAIYGTERVGISKAYLSESKQSADEFFENYIFRVWDIEATLKLECIGYLVKEQKRVPVCLIYNRAHSLLGYVAFNIANIDKPPKNLEEELLLYSFDDVKREAESALKRMFQELDKNRVLNFCVQDFIEWMPALNIRKPHTNYQSRVAKEMHYMAQEMLANQSIFD